MVAFVPIIMVLGRIAVKVGSKTVKDYLKKNGFRIAKNYKKYAETVTQKDLPALLKKVKDASGVKPSNVKGPGGSTMTTAGSRGQSALGRRLALSKLKSRGKVGPTKSAAKEPLVAPKRVPDKTTTPTTSVPNRLAQGLNIAAAGGIAKVAYDAYKDREAANKKFEEARRARSDLSTAKDKRSLARKVRAAKNVAVAKENKVAAEKKLDQQVTKMLSKSPKEQAEAADTPARKKAIMRALKEAMDFQSDKNKGK